MQAVSYLAPALAPLAIKLIDKYIFDDQPAAVPQIIQIPAPPQCHCNCGQLFTDDYLTKGTCSTCAASSTSSSTTSSSRRHTKRHRLSTKSRSSSTSEAYDPNIRGYSTASNREERRKTTQRSSSSRRPSDSANKSGITSDKHGGEGDTLEILAANLKKEISARKKSSEFSSIVKSSTKRKSHDSKLDRKSNEASSRFLKPDGCC